MVPFGFCAVAEDAVLVANDGLCITSDTVDVAAAERGGAEAVDTVDFTSGKVVRNIFAGL